LNSSSRSIHCGIQSKPHSLKMKSASYITRRTGFSAEQGSDPPYRLVRDFRGSLRDRQLDLRIRVALGFALAEMVGEIGHPACGSRCRQRRALNARSECAALPVNDRRRCDTSRKRIDGRRKAGARGQRFIHHAGSGMLEPGHVTELVHYHGQQIHVAGRKTGDRQQRAVLRDEFAIVARRVIDEPAVARRIGVDPDRAVAIIADLQPRQVGDLERDGAQRRDLRRVQRRGEPAYRLVYDRLQVASRDRRHAAGDVRRIRREHGIHVQRDRGIGRLDRNVVELRCARDGHQPEAPVHGRGVVRIPQNDLTVERYAHGRALERHPERVVDACVEHFRVDGVVHPSAARRVVTGDDLVGHNVDYDELEVRRIVAVVNEAGAALRGDEGAQVEYRRNIQVLDAEIHEADGRAARRDVVGLVRRVAGDAPRARARRELVGDAVLEGLERLQRVLRRQHLHPDVVENTARVVGANTDETVVQAERDPVDHARLVRVREHRLVVDQQRRVQAVDRNQHVVRGIGLQAAEERRLLVDDPAARIAVAHDQLVQRDVEAGKFEIGFALVVEDDVAVRFPA